jgi:hypothetical protein
MTAKLLGVGGYASSGKDTVAKHLVNQYGWTRDAFADRLRKGLLALDPIVEVEMRSGFEDYVHTERLSEIVIGLGWDKAKREYPEIRELLQRYGDEAGRQIHGKDCWVDALFRETYDMDLRIEKTLGKPVLPLVIPDVRYPNEIRAIRDRSGLLLWVDRPGVGPVNSHASDNSVGPHDFDYTVVNEGTIEELNAKIDRLVKDRGWA